MRDRHFDFGIGETFPQIIRQSLGGRANGVLIHPIGAYADDAAKPAGAKFQVFVKGIGDFCVIFAIDEGFDGCFRVVVIISRDPCLNFLAGDGI